MKTQIIEHAQGSNAWHVHRAKHLNASDIAAVMGLSSYKTRSQLLKEKATGLVPEVDSATQRRFDKGHEFEATAIPWAEEIIEGYLYPLVLAAEVDGLPLSASLDGLTMEQDVSFEHKTGRADLLASLEAGVIPDEYHPQLEQGMMLSGAKKCLFMASRGDKTTMRFAWYAPNLELRAKIIAAWKQFEQDLAAYAPPEATMPVMAAPQMGLPTVSIQVNGSIALVDNLDNFGTALTAYIARINKTPETDQDFADLEATVKALKAAEDALDAAEQGALAQTESIDAMRKTVGLYRDTARANRLLVEKLVKAEKENRRIAIISEAAAELIAHMRKLNERLGKPYMPTVAADFQGVIKGLKSLDSMKDKVAGELARCKIESNTVADRIQANLTTLRELAAGHTFLFADTATIVLKANDDLTALVKSRIAEHQAAEAAKEEATRVRIRAEEQAKAEQGARDKLALEQEAAEKKSREQIIQANAEAQNRIAEARDADAMPAPLLNALSDAANALMADTVGTHAIAAASKKSTESPTLKLSMISERLCFNLTAEFLASLGLKPAAKLKGAVLFHESDFPRICAALVQHINSVCETA